MTKPCSNTVVCKLYTVNCSYVDSDLYFSYSIHLCCTLIHTRQGVADRFIKDVRDSVAEIMKEPKAKCGGAVSTLITIVICQKKKPSNMLIHA